MNLKSYLDLYTLLKTDKTTVAQRRAFGLEHITIKNRPIEQLVRWSQEHIKTLPQPLMSEKFSFYLYVITFILVVIAFILGLFSGIALLSYNGHEPVNVVYFMSMVIFLPLVTMLLALFSMFRASSAQSVLVHISPAYWMEKMIGFLPFSMQENIKELQINPLLANWIVIKRSQFIALFFSLGLLVALLSIVATKDIAFAWSTTLDISAETFHGFLSTLAMPWHAWVPEAVPSLPLIEQSQYFRLGDRLSEEMISHASTLGQWWKFLAMSTLFYAVFLRLLMYIVAVFGFKWALKKSFLSIEGVRALFRDMNEAMISTSALNEESEFISFADGSTVPTVHTLDSSYDMVQGWAIPKEQLIVLNDSMHILCPHLFEVGGGNSLAEDSNIIRQSSGEILLYVKAWEPPTMDFMDYIDALLVKVDKVIIYPIGMAEEGYKPKMKFVDIWARKISTLKEEKVWLKRAKSENSNV